MTLHSSLQTPHRKTARRAVFLDRDGTINVEKDYLYRVEDFVFIPRVVEAIRALKSAGYLVIVVTNQSGVARGYYSLADVERLHTHMQQALAEQGAQVDAFYVCPHHPMEGRGEFKRDCECRKGAPGMLLQAAREHDIDLKRSYIVGDKLADVEAGERAGCTPLLVLTGYGSSEAAKLDQGRARLCADLYAASEAILSD